MSGVSRRATVAHARPDLLFLCHRIPYPPDKGDKIRSFRWLIALARSYRVHLGAFVDDPADWEHVERIQALCASSLFLPLPRRRAMVRALSGLASGQPLTMPFYFDSRMQRWVFGRFSEARISHVFVYSAAMAQYVIGTRFGSVYRVIDFVDVDSAKWRGYSELRSWPASWIYRREARSLGIAEGRIAHAFDRSLFVSQEEASLFRGTHQSLESRVTSVPNGVDCDYFSPDTQLASPYPADREAVVFTGAMDYWANADAVDWLVREIWPGVRKARPNALLAIVGARPTAAVQSLACDDIKVTGRVPDVRPYLEHACCAVAPMRVARGVQNKVLEAMAMAKPMVTTSQGLEGICAQPDRDLLVANDSDSFTSAVLAVMGGSYSGLGIAARRLMVERYDWASSTALLEEILRGGVPEALHPNSGPDSWEGSTGEGNCRQ